jgi:hypothetical protein
MEPEQVLELIRSAPERYESVRAALRYRGDGPVHKEIHERIVRRAFRVSTEQASKPIRHPEPDGPFGWRCRAWHADHYHWRMETEVPIGGPPGSGLVWNRRLGAPSRDPDPLHWGADEYEVVVDTERGVLLRCASRLGGKDFDALEVEEIYFDEHLGEDVFTSREPLPWRS